MLFTSFPAYGHFHPIAPLALAAGDAGHEVRVASGPDLRDWIAGCGLDAWSVGLGQAEGLRLASEAIPGPAASAHLFASVWVSAALPDLLAASGSWAPDVVVHEEAEYAGPLLAAILGVPLVTHSWPAPVRPLAGRRAMRERLRPLWGAYGKEAALRIAGDLYLDACPAPLQSADIATVENVVPVRPIPFDGPPSAPPPWLREVARPAAYVTLGTVPLFSTPELLATVVRAVAPLVATVIVTTGPNPVGALGALPTNVHAHAYLPQSSVLDRVDLVVSHGGAGSTIGALSHGLPHLVLPGNAQSQVQIATAIAARGAGLSLAEGKRDDGTIRAAAARLLGDEQYRTRARQLQAELAGAPSPPEVLRLIAGRLGLA